MSISSAYAVSDRIKEARHDSPIAVFKTEKPMEFDAVFANTVMTRQRIKKAGAVFVGIFNNDNFSEFMDFLNAKT